MKKFLFLTSVLFVSSQIFAQDLIFDKRFIDCEENWVAVEQNKANSYLYGFVFIEENVGLNLCIEGNFTIDNDGVFIPQKNKSSKLNIIKLEPDDKQVALIPNSKLEELNLPILPSWITKYKKKPTAQSLCNIAFIYNKWKSCYNALVYLKLADEKKAKFRAFFSEMAYSYNCMGAFNEAIEVAEIGAKRYPDDALICRELIFAQANAGLANDAAKSCKKALTRCTDKSYDGENCYNVLRAYYKDKDFKKFAYWLKLAKNFNKNSKKIMGFISEMEYTMRSEGGNEFFE
ncbi:MAG: hypothetical protein LBS50_04730 [Prevotellaceae bacterium]|jgi:tetratricopeptide (TPR) repeat protein|nr:hypothetical protein [Prevotellaceae bacterium]